MSEELTLLGGSFNGSELWVACGNMRKCRMAGPSRKTVAEAVAAWNAMPPDVDGRAAERGRKLLVEVGCRQ